MGSRRDDVVRKLRGPALRGYQVSVLQALLRGIERHPGETFTVLFPRQAGKNEVAAALVAGLLRAHASDGGSVVVCAPSLQPQAEISLARLRRTLAATDHLFPRARSRASGNRVFVGRAEAVFLSGAATANVAGHTASLALIGDEAQDLDRDWFERQFRPMAASTGAPTVLFGTPWDGHSLLDLAVQRNRRRDAAQPGRRFRDWLPFHHEVNWRQVAEAVPRYGAYVEAQRAALGANHPIFATQYALRTTDRAGRLLSSEQLAGLASAHTVIDTPRGGERYVAGFDIAGDGRDRSVLTIARVAGERMEVVAHEAWERAPLRTQLEEALAIARRWRLERLCVDGSGLGAQVGQELAAELGESVEALTFTAAVKSDLGYELLAAVELGRLCVPREEQGEHVRRLWRELRECVQEKAPGGQLRWRAARGHDDYVVSLARAVRAAKRSEGPRIASGRRAGG